MSRQPKRPPAFDEARILDALATILTGATEDRTWVPALRAVELLGRHIGMWTNDAQPRTSLAELINQAAGGTAEPTQ